jgi:hypothetical protein
MTKTSTLTACSTPKSKRITRIHVNQHAIRKNLKDATDAPVITVKQSDSNTYGHEVHILDDAGHVIARVRQPFGETLSCGARVWIETFQPVVVLRRGD